MSDQEHGEQDGQTGHGASEGCGLVVRDVVSVPVRAGKGTQGRVLTPSVTAINLQNRTVPARF